MSEHYDVIVIGTGAGGGTLARHLAPSGKRILLLERGDWLPREPGRAGRTRRTRPPARRTPIPRSPTTGSPSPSNPTAAKRLFAQLKSMVGSLGMYDDHMARRFAYMKTDIPYAGCAHQAGTVRFGADPATSVLNPDCRAHEVDNLYVVDTSFFPSISAVNPALTAMANAIRVGDHLLERLG
jgi:choline dehydrogenase-like flavoprotein